jgi:hypothetical protein
MAITRTAKGAIADKTNQTTWTALSSVSMASGDYLLVGAVGDLISSGITWNGITVPLVGGNGGANMYGLLVASGAAGNIVVTFGAASGAHALFATSVSGLASSALDVSSGNNGTSTTPSDPGVTTNKAVEIFIGALYTNGPSGDAVGTWGNSWSAGQRAGTIGSGATSNYTIQEGFKIVSAIESSQASLTGITSRAWGIHHDTWIGKVFAPALPLMVGQAVNRASFF